MQEDVDERLIYQGFESKNLDYKSPMGWDANTDSTRGLVKDIVAMANSGGGHIIIGVDDGCKPIGLFKSQLDSFDSSKIGDYVNNYIDPPVNITVIKKNIEKDKKDFVIIVIPDFPEIPHLCKKNFDNTRNKPLFHEGDIFVRNDNNESVKIKTAHDMRTIINSSVLKSRDTVADFISKIFKSPIPKSEEDSISKYDRQLDMIKGRFKDVKPGQ